MGKDIEEIINTKKGKINLDFWRKIIMEKKEDGDWKGCGSEGEDKITGWILDFYWRIGDISRDSYLEDEVLEVSIQITEIGSKEKAVNYIISSGIRDLKQDPKTFVVETIVNYCFYKDREMGISDF